MADNTPLTIADTCENASWWTNRGVLYTRHAVERAQTRRILLPDKFDSCTDLVKGYGSVWMFHTIIEGHVHCVVASPHWRGDRCYISVITIYFNAPGRKDRKIERYAKRFIREAKRQGREAIINQFNAELLLRQKNKTDRFIEKNSHDHN